MLSAPPWDGPGCARSPRPQAVLLCVLNEVIIHPGEVRAHWDECEHHQDE